MVRGRQFFFIFVGIGAVAFLRALPAHAAISLVETQCSTYTNSVTFNTPTTAGELVVVSVGAAQGGGLDGGVADNAPGGSSSYTSLASIAGFGAGGKSAADFYYAYNVASGITTVTLSVGAGNNVVYSGLCAAHYKGVLASSNPLDVAEPFTAAQGTPWASASTGQLAQTNELVVGTVMEWPNGGDCGTFASTGPLVQEGTYFSNVGVCGTLAGAVMSTTTSVTYAGTGGDNYDDKTVAVAAFRTTPPDATPPSVPANLSASAVSASQINISWDASTDNVGVAGYYVYRNGTKVGSVAGTTYSDTGLAASTTYTYTVAAYDSAGNVSSLSAQASATTQASGTITPPSAPTNLSANPVSSSQISLSWTASTPGTYAIAGYDVFRDGTQVGTASTPAYADSNLAAGTTYRYAVAAYDTKGVVSAQSATVSATTKAANSGRTFYISTSGDDNNGGTSKSTSWAHLPGMPDCTGTCASTTPQPDDSFILRGGDIWGKASLGMNWHWSGTAAAPIYIGVDKTWYGGGSWSRPVFDCGGQACSTNDTYFIGCGSTLISYVTLDNIEMTGLLENAADNYGEYVEFCGTYDTVSNLYLHGWSHGSAQYDNMVGISFNGGYDATGDSAYGNVIDGSDTTRDSLAAFFSTAANLYDNVVRYVSNGFEGASNDIHNNWFGPIVYCFSSSGCHQNAIQQASPYKDTNVVVYDNVITGVASGGMGHLWVEQSSVDNGSLNTYVFGNVMYDNAPGNDLDICQLGTNCGTFYIFNNTFQCGNDASVDDCTVMNGSGSGPQAVVHFINNHWIDAGPTNSTITVNNVPNWTFTETTDLIQTVADASADGYKDTSVPYAFSPASASGGTVGAGTNEQSLCSTIASFNSAAGAACKSDTGYACTYDQANHTVSCPARTEISRPAAGAWDIGAYQYSSSAGGGNGDATPPIVSVTSPSQGATVSGAITVSADASDNVGVTKVEFYMDNVLQSTDTASPYAFSWSTNGVTDGPHVLSAKAYDAAGNVGVSANVAVTVSNVSQATATATDSSSGSSGGGGGSSVAAGSSGGGGGGYYYAYSAPSTSTASSSIFGEASGTATTGASTVAPTLEATLASLIDKLCSLVAQAQSKGIEANVGSLCNPAADFTRNLALGDRGSDVEGLQHYLNINGFPVVTTPAYAGSLGYETQYFGPKTKLALQKFQASHGIPATGFFGPITRGWIADH